VRDTDAKANAGGHGGFALFDGGGDSVAIARLDFVGDVELKLGVAFRDEDVEFLETPSDLIERGAEILIRGGVR